MSVEEKIKSLGLKIPEAPKPVAAYIPAIKVDNYVYTSGQIPFEDGKLIYKGKVGKDISEDEAFEAAKICALNCLSVIKGVIGTLDKIEQIVKVTGYVASEKGFDMQSKVINGASELLGEIFAEKGKHARSAVGVAELPLNASCEIEMIVKVN